jgi:hypothetical protein
VVLREAVGRQAAPARTSSMSRAPLGTVTFREPGLPPLVLHFHCSDPATPLKLSEPPHEPATHEPGLDARIPSALARGTQTRFTLVPRMVAVTPVDSVEP